MNCQRIITFPYPERSLSITIFCRPEEMLQLASGGDEEPRCSDDCPDVVWTLEGFDRAVFTSRRILGRGPSFEAPLWKKQVWFRFKYMVCWFIQLSFGLFFIQSTRYWLHVRRLSNSENTINDKSGWGNLIDFHIIIDVTVSFKWLFLGERNIHCLSCS